MSKNFIEQKPDFETLVELREGLKSAVASVTSLADSGDTAQRATDLWIQIDDIHKQAKSVLFQD